EIELLIGAADYDIRFEDDRVISLNQGIQKLMDGDRLLVLKPFVEIIALEHAGDIIARGKVHELFRRHRIHPPAIELQNCADGIENLENLALIGLGVLQDLGFGQSLPGLRHPGRIPYHAGKITDEKDYLMPKILKVLQLVDKY